MNIRCIIVSNQNFHLFWTENWTSALSFNRKWLHEYDKIMKIVFISTWGAEEKPIVEKISRRCTKCCEIFRTIFLKSAPPPTTVTG